MAIADTAKLMSSLDLDTRKFDSGVAKASKGLGTLQTRTIAAGTAIGVGIERLAEKGLSALGGAIGEGIQGALTLEKAQAQTAAVIASTGNAAGISAQQIRDMANALEDVTTVDDKTIQQAENLLLTFTNIGHDVFPAAIKAATDMAIALNKGDAATADIDGSATRLGKALQDPIKGITALSKAGVNFTAQQKEQIKALVKAGRLQDAQKIILAELTKEYGNAGKAAGTGFAADISRANDAIDDAKISIAQGLIPAVGEVAVELKKTLDDPQVKEGLVNLGKGIGTAIKGVVAFAKTVPWGAIASSLQAAAGFAADLAKAFLSLPAWVQTAVITGWGLNKLTGGALTGLVGSLASGLVKGVLGINAGVVKLTAGTVVGGPGAGVPTGAAGAASTGLSTVAKVALIGEAVGLVLAVNQVRDGIATASSQQATQIHTQTSDFIASQPNKAQLETALAGVNQGIHDLEFNPLNVLVQGDALDQLRSMRADLQTAIANQPLNTDPGSVSSAADAKRASDIAAFAAKLSVVATNIETAANQRDAETSSSIQTLISQDATIAQTADVENLQAKTAAALASLDQTTYTGTSATTQAARTAGMAAASAAYGAGAGVEQAIRANRPIINVDVQISATDITQVNVVEDRGGSRSGSRDGDGGGGPGQGP